MVDLKTARDLGTKALRAAAEGHDPASAKAETRAADTVAEVVEQFLALHCARHNRPRTIEGTERLLKTYVLPSWRHRLLKDISRRDVIEVLDRVVADGKATTANRVLAATRKMFNWAVSRDIIGVSPCAGVTPPAAEQSRDRILSDIELKVVWRAATELDGPFGALVRLLILTAQRRDEIARLQYSEIHLDKALIALPAERMKGKQAHEVPLSVQAVAILKGLPRIGDTFVLTNDGETPASNYSADKRKLDAMLPSINAPWRLHDLRRTAASGMAKLGVQLPVIEKILNHTSGSFGGVAGIYQRHDFAGEKYAAMALWGAHVAAL